MGFSLSQDMIKQPRTQISLSPWAPCLVGSCSVAKNSMLKFIGAFFPTAWKMLWQIVKWKTWAKVPTWYHTHQLWDVEENLRVCYLWQSLLFYCNIIHRIPMQGTLFTFFWTCSLSSDFSFFPSACGVRPLLGCVVCLASVRFQKECKSMVPPVLWPCASQLVLWASVQTVSKGSRARRREQSPSLSWVGHRGFIQTHSLPLLLLSVYICLCLGSCMHLWRVKLPFKV